jgi:hypothetical protein
MPSLLFLGRLTMKSIDQIFISIMITVCMLVVTAVCWHSVEEIHYLKTFYPKQFSVEEAFFASAVELVKSAIISLPLVLIIAIGLFLLHYFKKAS